MSWVISTIVLGNVAVGKCRHKKIFTITKKLLQGNFLCLLISGQCLAESSKNVCSSSSKKVLHRNHKFQVFPALNSTATISGSKIYARLKCVQILYGFMGLRQTNQIQKFRKLPVKNNFEIFQKTISKILCRR